MPQAARPLPWITPDHYRRGVLPQLCPGCNLLIPLEQISAPRLEAGILTADIHVIPVPHDCEQALAQVAEQQTGELITLNRRAA